MEITGLVKAVMEEIKSTVRSDTVIGSPVQSADSTIIPVSKVSFGFGAGGSERDVAKARSGMGAGAGVSIEPVAFMVLTNGKAQLLPVKSRDAMLSRLIDMIPRVLELIQDMMNRKKGNSGAGQREESAA